MYQGHAARSGVMSGDKSMGSLTVLLFWTRLVSLKEESIAFLKEVLKAHEPGLEAPLNLNHIV